MRMLGTLSLKLESFSVRGWDNEGGTEFDRHGNEFVRSMDSLQRLHLVLDPHWDDPDNILLDWSALHAYAHKAKSLKVHCIWNQRLFALGLEGSDFRHFCKKASALQQISMDVLVGRELSGCKHSLPPTDHIQNMLKPLKSPRLLKLSVGFSSSNETDTSTQMLCMAPLIQPIEHVVGQVFALKLPELTAVVMVALRHRDHELTHNQIAFLRSK